MSDVILKADRVSRGFGRFPAVQDLSLEIYRGDIYGFLGLNGAGKTTAIRMFLRLIRPESGKILLFGKDLDSDYLEIMHSVGGLVETPAFYPYLSGRANLRLLAGLRAGGSKNRINSAVDELLVLVGLDRRADDRIRAYSLGMKQRLGVAAALLPAFLPRTVGGQTPLIILDEPTNGLDPQGIADIRNLIKKLNREKEATFFISSHLLSEIELLCNRVGIIRQGRLVISDDLAILLKKEGGGATESGETVCLCGRTIRRPAEGDPKRPLEKYFMGLM